MGLKLYSYKENRVEKYRRKQREPLMEEKIDPDKLKNPPNNL